MDCLIYSPMTVAIFRKQLPIYFYGQGASPQDKCYF